MFLAAVARPRWDIWQNRNFDGKLGIWPFFQQVQAQQTSRNRPAGTLETKAIDSDTNVEYRDFLISRLLPAIREKWPLQDMNTPIKIQQDNAKPHISVFNAAVLLSGLNIHLDFQPGKSPGLNVLDLSYFNTIQALQWETKPKMKMS